ncbi:Haloacetate dehalogenase [Aulographum hederae CBS 113979]|uniref:Haloacetate dehalogenase n=1 Tax=Aulographum hederae CBS 113979 TaxID=1176131 RepID=A0A6G1H6S4_9PEZI|nr:Haloacetate dehalogenase [Aulographum hederae CBS 113979]
MFYSSARMKLGSGFQEFNIETEEGVFIHGNKGGSGPGLLLLHGYPQTHLMWHKIAPRLTETYTVIAIDLRGYGGSSKPSGRDLDNGGKGDPDHELYRKDTLAKDCATVMEKLGHSRYYVAGHDRGGRVAHQLCIDFPDNIMKVMMLDLCPTLTHYDDVTTARATSYWHWFFNIQPAPFPEEMILSNPSSFARRLFKDRDNDPSVFVPEAMAQYVSQLADPHAVHAMCEDFRAGATSDLVMQRRDREEGRKIQCPLRVLWGTQSIIGTNWNPVAEWKKVCAASVEGKGMECGHYVAEEHPDLLLKHMEEFFFLAF